MREPMFFKKNLGPRLRGGDYFRPSLVLRPANNFTKSFEFGKD